MNISLLHPRAEVKNYREAAAYEAILIAMRISFQVASCPSLPLWSFWYVLNTESRLRNLLPGCPLSVPGLLVVRDGVIIHFLSGFVRRFIPGLAFRRGLTGERGGGRIMRECRTIVWIVGRDAKGRLCWLIVCLGAFYENYRASGLLVRRRGLKGF